MGAAAGAKPEKARKQRLCCSNPSSPVTSLKTFGKCYRASFFCLIYGLFRAFIVFAECCRLSFCIPVNWGQMGAKLGAAAGAWNPGKRLENSFVFTRSYSAVMIH